MTKDAFEKQIPEIKALLQNNNVRTYVENTLVVVLNALEIENSREIVSKVISMAQSYDQVKDYEAKANRLLKSKGVTKQRIEEELSGRASLIYSQIRDYVKGKVLDFGCGDGKVGERISQDCLEVVLADVYEHDYIKETGLSFHEFKQGERSHLEPEEYDTTLLLTVMHHSDDPIKTLEEAKRSTKKGGRIIVIESVYGVGPTQVESTETFITLNHEDQRLSSIFFDHFYNRVIHYSNDPVKKVNVPFSFNTPQGWNEEAENLGMTVIATKHLGIDQALVPEYHTLHVWEVQNEN